MVNDLQFIHLDGPKVIVPFKASDFSENKRKYEMGRPALNKNLN
uniref:Uncharacterized protein n=1 Tax=Arundo donax TaxID=35708 RepID=A0A0A9BAH2_ARUDO